MSGFERTGELSSLRKEGMAVPLDEAAVGERRHGRRWWSAMVRG
jgi:hypothetical protein